MPAPRNRTAGACACDPSFVPAPASGVFVSTTGSDAAAGNWTQETLNYSYDET